VNLRIFFLSLGCAKNTVDSESMATMLVREGCRLVASVDEADVIIVNTCGFIEPARKESFSELRRLVEQKSPGQILIAAGCLTQRYGEEIARQVPGIDGLLGTRRWMDIVDIVESLRARKTPQPLYHLPDADEIGDEDIDLPRTAIQGASAYLKIADGCSRPCAFCAIPLIKGPAVSRPPERILADARRLQDSGVREINLIAQDTTAYGHDLGSKDGLAQLIEDLVEAAPQVEWFRILYAYPGCVTDHLIDVIANSPQVVPYIDMPLQHAHPDVLRRMRRPANIEWVHRTLAKMRRTMPEVALRSTFIVGYPNETEQAFETLLEFVEDVHFDRVGVFTYSPEVGTESESLGDPISTEVKEERRHRLMRLQQQISLERNQSFIGESLLVLTEGVGDGITLGRSYRDAPEIDGLVIIDGEHPLGEMLTVKIDSAMPYDLIGRVDAGIN
jgi:ribosomal protein S12 methylthiotransferase